jgi:hypothetical protein
MRPILTAMGNVVALRWSRSILPIALLYGSLAACDQTENRVPAAVGQAEVTSGTIAAAAALPTPIPISSDLIEGLSAGQSASLVLDKCPQPAPPSLGSLICGETYRVYWDSASQRWVGMGPNKVLPVDGGYDVTLAKYPGTKPQDRVMVVWGLWLTIKPDWSVEMEKGPIIGTLRHTKPNAIPPALQNGADQIAPQGKN